MKPASIKLLAEGDTLWKPVVHQNETLACRSTARQPALAYPPYCGRPRLRQGRLRGDVLSIAKPALAVLGYFRREVEPQARIFIMLVH